MTGEENKLGLNWAKLSSNQNWDLLGLLHYIDDYKLPLHITEHKLAYFHLHTSLLNR